MVFLLPRHAASKSAAVSPSSLSSPQIPSRKPCSRRNSELWKPAGSFWPMVCSITRGPAKADQSARLRQNNIPQHGKTRRYPRRSWDSSSTLTERRPASLWRRKAAAVFCHLHEGGHTLLHPGPAGANKKDHRQAVFCCPFHRSGDLFSHHFPHARHEKAAVADAENRGKPVDPAFSCEYGLVKAGLFPKIRDLSG